MYNYRTHLIQVYIYQLIARIHFFKRSFAGNTI